MDAELNLSILFSLARFLHDKYGIEELDKAASKADISASEALTGKQWVSVKQVESFIEHVDDLLEGDELALRKAASYRLEEAYGPFRFIIWALSPSAVYKQAMKNFHVVSACGSYTLLDEGPLSISASFTSSRETGRLLCLVRQANIMAMPTFWGLPPAEVREEGCLGHGDGKCVYHVRWRRKQSWWPLIAGLTAGAGVATGLEMLGLSSTAIYFIAPMLGASVGHMIRQLRINRDNLRFAQENNEALQHVAREATVSRHEIVALNERQREWSSLMEQQLAERTATLEKMLETVDELKAEQIAVVREYSHDLRNPLTIIKCSAEMFKDFDSSSLSTGDVEMLRDLGNATAKMERIVAELMSVATPSENDSSRRSPEIVNVSAFANQVRRQLRAFVYGRDIRVSAFCTREAPMSIETDRLLFDRVIDNILFNAVKYTEKGSIVVEIDGLPGFLAVKISDTGRGIAEDQIEHIFRPGGSAVETRAENSYGLGLSVVVKLLDDIGGRLEVLSKPGLGTTFWVYIPTKMEPSSLQKERTWSEKDNDPEVVTRVVTIRRAANNG